MASRGDTDGGFVLIYRRLLDNPVFRNHAEAMAFAYMIMRASWRPTKVRYKGHEISLERGQLALSLRDFAAHMDRDRNWSGRFLKRLRSEQMVSTNRDSSETASETGPLVITICNYDSYQAFCQVGETPRDQHPSQKRDSSETQNKESNKGTRKEGESPYVDSPVDDGVEKPVHFSAQEAWGAWNRTAELHGWPKIIALTEKRRDKLRLRIKEVGKAGWLGALDKAAKSQRLGHADAPSWWTFDWLITNDTNIQKVLEGNYDKPFDGNGASRPKPEGSRTVRIANKILAEDARKRRERDGIRTPPSDQP